MRARRRLGRRPRRAARPALRDRRRRARAERATTSPRYDVVVLQQARGAAWVELIRRLQAQGTTVLYEIDDDLQSVRKAVDHVARGLIDRGWVRDARAGDARLRRRHLLHAVPRAPLRGHRDPHVGVPQRPRPAALRAHPPRARPRRDRLGGRRRATSARSRPWLPAVRDVMRARPATRFVTIGRRYADELAEEFGRRALPLDPLRPARDLPGRDDELRRRARARRAPRTSSAPRATCAGSRPPRSASPSSPTRSSTPTWSTA